MWLPFLQVSPDGLHYQGSQSLQVVHHIQRHQVHPTEKTQPQLKRCRADPGSGNQLTEISCTLRLTQMCIDLAVLQVLLGSKWWTDGCFMFSREEPAFILLQKTPEITELTRGWSQPAQSHQAPAARLWYFTSFSSSRFHSKLFKWLQLWNGYSSVLC